jgi:fructokinase
MIYCFGEVLWDMLPNESLAGGAPMNVCIHLNKLGSNATIISAVGADQEGEELISYLEENNIDLKYIQQKHSLPTGKVLVNLDDPLNAVYDIVHPVAYDAIAYAQVPEIHAQDADFLIFGSLALRDAISRNTLLNLLEQPFTKVFDINLRPPYDDPELIKSLLKKVDWVKLNEDEFEQVCVWYDLSPDDKQIFSKLAKEWGAKLICVTKGGKGATLFYDQQIFDHPGYPVQVADTVGAGDAFLAALIHSFISHKNPGEMLSNACALGAFVAGKKGGNPVYQPSAIKHFTV